ncbi:MAG: thioredoxin domain-containing protein [Actinomycetes bacterium]
MSTKDSKKTTKEKAAAARAEAEATQRGRDRRVRIIGGVVILALVAGIIGVGVYGAHKNAPVTGIVADAAVPKGVNASGGTYPWGVVYNTAASKPTLAIWEDFECPSCGALEAKMGKNITKLADDGKVNLIWRPTAFLDAKFVTSANSKSSLRATAAWGCAIDAGKVKEFHTVMFANQPATEGIGWTEQQLLDFGTQAGITGDAYSTYEGCVKDGTYMQWASNSNQTFSDDGIPGTPTAFLNGTEVTSEVMNDAVKLEKAISDAAAAK